MKIPLILLTNYTGNGKMCMSGIASMEYHFKLFKYPDIQCIPKNVNIMHL